MSKKDFGGKITMKLSTGQVFSLRGTLNLSPSRMSAEAITNQDMSVDRVLTPQPARFEVSFADRGLNYNALMQANRFNVTFVEDTTNVTHYFTDAFLTGDPQVNRINGEVTGLAGAANKYQHKG